MGVPQDRRYLETHEWHRRDGELVTIGITQFAADQLSDVTYVELPAAGTELIAGKAFGEIESVKATSELYAGVSGTVREVNRALDDTPELVNNDPFGGGWMLKLQAHNPADVELLMSAAAYEQRYPE